MSYSALYSQMSGDTLVDTPCTIAFMHVNEKWVCIVQNQAFIVKSYRLSELDSTSIQDRKKFVYKVGHLEPASLDMLLSVESAYIHNYNGWRKYVKIPRTLPFPSDACSYGFTTSLALMHKVFTYPIFPVDREWYVFIHRIQKCWRRAIQWRRQQRRLALSMGMHERLGAGALLNMLPAHLLASIIA
jgi:hypothetical protein